MRGRARVLSLSMARVFGASMALGVLSSAGLAQNWTRLTRDAPAAVNLLLLLPNGTVMAANQPPGGIGNGWFRLTPDSRGNYATGTWSAMPSMVDTRLYYSSQILKDGRVFVAGGEYGTGTARGEIYDAVTNLWTQLMPPPIGVINPNQPSPVLFNLPQGFYDSSSMILPNGSVIIAPTGARVARQTVLFNPTTNAWTNGPNLFRGESQAEANWVKLPDDSVLTIDPSSRNSERYIPATNTWVNDAVLPLDLYDTVGGELGAGVLLSNGRALFLGGTGHTALYTPSGTASPGTWAAGPDIPNGLATPDAPAAVLTTGEVLCAVSQPLQSDGNGGVIFPSPTSFCKYNPTTNAFTMVNGPVGPTINEPCFTSAMLQLPDGSVLYSHFATDVYVYRPTGTPLAAGKPTIIAITQNADGSYHLTGTGLNGISEGASYGDDIQMSTNYPLVRVTSLTGVVSYARTYNWSSTSVATGSRVVSTEFRLPANLLGGEIPLVVVANGVASDPVTFLVPGPAACCVGTACAIVTAGNCPGGLLSTSTSCTPSPCTQMGACCAASGGCTVTVLVACAQPSVSLGAGTTCAPNPCPTPPGACCTGVVCVITDAAGCVAPAQFRGANTVCGTPGNPTSCCRANVNGADGVTVQDIFDFLGFWFTLDPRGNFNGVAGVTVQDIFDYLSAYFAGC